MAGIASFLLLLPALGLLAVNHRIKLNLFAAHGKDL